MYIVLNEESLVDQSLLCQVAFSTDVSDDFESLVKKSLTMTNETTIQSYSFITYLPYKEGDYPSQQKVLCEQVAKYEEDHVKDGE